MRTSTKISISFLLLLVCAGLTAQRAVFFSQNVVVSGGSGVAYDSQCSNGSTGTVTTLNCSLTIGSISNGAVVIGLSIAKGVADPTGITCTVGGTSASAISGADSGATSANARAALFGLATGSTTGAQSVSCSWTNATSLVIGAASFSGVNQTTPFAHGTADAQFSTGPATITITSATNDQTFSAAYGANNNSLSSPTQTQRYLTNDNSFTLEGGGQTAAGAASVSHAWTLPGSQNWAIAGVDVQHL